MKLLVTGHLGYLGSVMVPFLRARGHEVVGLDTGFFAECTLGEVPEAAPEIRKDVRDVAPEDLAGFDAVLHLAALSNDPLGDLGAEWTDEINRSASVRLARLAKEAGVSRFLFASSCSMYGAADGGEVLDETAPLRPLTAYAVSKARAEAEISRLADPGFSPTFLRNATVYGFSPRLRADVVLNNLVGWAVTTGRVRITSDGTPWRPIAHVEDVARAFEAVLLAPRGAVHDQAFNVGSDRENYQVRDLGRIVEETVPGCAVEYAGEATADPRSYRVDFGKISRVLPGFAPRWTAREGARELFERLRAADFSLDRFEGRKYVRLRQIRFLLDDRRLDGSLRWRGPA